MKAQPLTFYKKEDNNFYQILKSKSPDYSEIIVNLFDHCNLRCVFCPQDHEDRTGTSKKEILSKIGPVLEYIKSSSSNEFHIHMMGGELFQDEFINQGFLDIYAEFMETLEQLVPTNKVLVFNYITNLVFDETNKVLEFITAKKLKIAISYDPVGRFNKAQFEIFKKNIEIFKSHIRMVSCTMTKNSMKRIIDGDEYFDYLYNNFDCDWDYLLPGDDKLKIMMPSEADLFEFLKLLINKYPECINISSFIEKGQNKIPCTRGKSFTIFSDNSIPRGCSGSVIMKNSKTEDLGTSEIVEKFLSKYNCLECEYYSRCSFTCFVSHDYKDMIHDMDECVYKATFRYADTKNSIS
jgi:organic radical activating enzyme